jgi:hypothetical protein
LIRNTQKQIERIYFNWRINLIPEKNILFFGDPRGGTTWMGETLSELFKLPILWEPMLVRKDSRFAKFNFASRQYLDENYENEQINNSFLNLLKGKGIDHWEIKHTNTKELRKSKAAIIKFTRGSMLLPYITKQFSFEKKPIYMIRNPFAVVASQLKHPGWKNADSHFEIPTGIYNEVYDIHAEFLKTLQTKEEVLTAEWALSNKVVLNHSRHNKDWIFITYEQTLINPKQTLIKILAEWNCSNLKLDKLDFNRKSRTSLSKKITPVNVQLEHWKSSFTSLQIQKMQDVLNYFEIDYNNLSNK